MKIKELFKKWEKRLLCLHIYDVKFIDRYGSIYLAEVCEYCGKIKIIC